MNKHDLQPGLSRKVAATARDLYEEPGSANTLQRALQLAVEFIPGADDAGITLIRRGQPLETPEATSGRAYQVDQLQYQAGTGPCIDALSEREVISVPDLESDQRWGTWGRRTAAETGTRSMLCFRLFTNDDVLGALNLYSDRSHAFTPDDVDHGLAFAAQAAVALARARNAENFDAALDSRSSIGQAVGMLMERFQLDPDRAFEVLTRLSQHSNRKLRDIANELILTRKLPHDPFR